MKIEYNKEMLEQEAINKYLNMIANDYNGELAKTFQEKYINKEKEIERLTNELDREKSKVKEYGSRMLKAIEYIHNNYPVCAGKELLEILQGEDK